MLKAWLLYIACLSMKVITERAGGHVTTEK